MSTNQHIAATATAMILGKSVSAGNNETRIDELIEMGLTPAFDYRKPNGQRTALFPRDEVCKLANEEPYRDFYRAEHIAATTAIVVLSIGTNKKTTAEALELLESEAGVRVSRVSGKHVHVFMKDFIKAAKERGLDLPDFHSVKEVVEETVKPEESLEAEECDTKKTLVGLLKSMVKDQKLLFDKIAEIQGELATIGAASEFLPEIKREQDRIAGMVKSIVRDLHAEKEPS